MKEQRCGELQCRYTRFIEPLPLLRCGYFGGELQHHFQTRRTWKCCGCQCFAGAAGYLARESTSRPSQLDSCITALPLDFCVCARFPPSPQAVRLSPVLCNSSVLSASLENILGNEDTLLSSGMLDADSVSYWISLCLIIELCVLCEMVCLLYRTALPVSGLGQAAACNVTRAEGASHAECSVMQFVALCQVLW